MRSWGREEVLVAWAKCWGQEEGLVALVKS